MSLKESTSIKHKLAERHPFNTAIVSGKLSGIEYVTYLNQLYEVFLFLENDRELPILGDLFRSNLIIEDMEELEGRFQDDYIPDVLKSTKDYVNHMRSLNKSELLAHVYLNYMALLFGGQMIKEAIPGSGRTYDFNDKLACISFIRSFQKDEWAEEVNIGFDYIIAIYDELQTIFGLYSQRVPSED